MLSILIFVFALVVLILVLMNVPISQKVLNIFFLILVLLVAANEAGWLNGLTLHR